MFNISKYVEIREYIEKSGKNSEIIAISKNHSADKVLEAIQSGVYIFGENRVMEAKSKFTDLKKKFPEIKLHLTGPLQSNKVKQASQLFDVFHTLDREKIALEFSKYKEDLKEKQFFIQVNTGEEKSKSGVSPKELTSFSKFCSSEIKLNIVGLMCIPPIDDDPKNHFKLLQNLAKENNLNQLSIGMSNDYKDALIYNPTYIRLGTILFGERS